MAAIKWLQTVDANQKQAQNLVLHNNSGVPGTPIAGQIWYDSATGKMMYRDGVAAGNVDPRARATHTGTQASSTISDLATVVKAYRLDEFAIPTADINLNTHKLIGVVDPSNPQEAATKNYVDTALATALAGTSWKTPVRGSTTTNDSLSGLAARDGVTPVGGDRWLVKNQSTASANGIYLANSGAWTRATDADAAAELQGGTLVAIDEGTTLADTVWMLTTDVVTLGTTNQTWVQYGASATYTASLGVQLVGNDFRANLGSGLVLSGNTIVPDFGIGSSKVMRAKIAVGYVGTTGADVAITHSFALADKSDFICEVTENTTGAKGLCGVVGTDVNTVTLSFEATPTTNQYRYQILGLS
jgi:hypothetical protein